MKFTKITSSLVCLILCLSLFALPVHATQVSAPAPDIAASAALLIEMNSGTILYEKDIDARVYPASLTKIMTCLVTLENSTLNETVTVSETALNGLGEFSSTAGLHVGEQLSMENLLYCMMLSSANEACNIAAEHISGSTKAFVEKMNTRAAELGCTGTKFANTHGLHDGNHYTTARDLAIITQEALKNNTFREIVSTYSYKMPATNLSGTRTLTTTNLLMVPTATNKYYDKTVTGVKTGFTTPAGRCLIATAEKGTLNLLSIVCGCATRILETGDLEFASFPETQKLLSYAADNFTYETVLTKLYPLTEIAVKDSAGADFVSLSPQNEISVLLPKNYDAEQIQVECSLVDDEGVFAPISAGQVLGSVTIKYGNEVVGGTALVAITDVARASVLGILPGQTSKGVDVWLLIILALVILLCLVMLIAFTLQIAKSRKLRRRYEMERSRKSGVGKSHRE